MEESIVGMFAEEEGGTEVGGRWCLCAHTPDAGCPQAMAHCTSTLSQCLFSAGKSCCVATSTASHQGACTHASCPVLQEEAGPVPKDSIVGMSAEEEGGMEVGGHWCLCAHTPDAGCHEVQAAHRPWHTAQPPQASVSPSAGESCCVATSMASHQGACTHASCPVLQEEAGPVPKDSIVGMSAEEEGGTEVGGHWCLCAHTPDAGCPQAMAQCTATALNKASVSPGVCRSCMGPFMQVSTAGKGGTVQSCIACPGGQAAASSGESLSTSQRHLSAWSWSTGEVVDVEGYDSVVRGA